MGDRSYFDVYAGFAVFVNGVVGAIGSLTQNFTLPLLVIFGVLALLVCEFPILKGLLTFKCLGLLVVFFLA